MDDLHGILRMKKNNEQCRANEICHDGDYIEDEMLEDAIKLSLMAFPEDEEVEGR